jgi:hypothetical protein
MQEQRALASCPHGREPRGDGARPAIEIAVRDEELVFVAVTEEPEDRSVRLPLRVTPEERY